MFIKRAANHLSIIIGYTTIWHMLYYCTPVTNGFNEMIRLFHGGLITKK